MPTPRRRIVARRWWCLLGGWHRIRYTDRAKTQDPGRADSPGFGRRPMMPKPTIRFRYPSQAALEAMAVLRDRSEIYSDGFNLYECRGVARDKPEHFDFRIFRINAERLQELMDRAAIFETFDGRSDKWKPIYPPIKVARWILQDKESWPFKRLQTPEPLNYSEESS